MEVRRNQIYKSKTRGIIVVITKKAKKDGVGGQHWNARQKSGKNHQLSELALRKQFDYIGMVTINV